MTGKLVPRASPGLPLGTRCVSDEKSELVEPEVEATIIGVRLPQIVAPGGVPEGGISHVSGRPRVGRARGLRPLGTLAWPVVVWEVVVGVVVEPVQLLVLCPAGSDQAENDYEPQDPGDQPGQPS